MYPSNSDSIDKMASLTRWATSATLSPPSGPTIGSSASIAHISGYYNHVHCTQKPLSLAYIHAICREKYWQQQFEGNVDNKCSHDLVIVAHKVSDHHLLHDEQKGWAAMTSNWLHQLPKVVGIDKDILINQKSVQTTIQNLHPEFHVSRNNCETWSWYWLALKRHSLQTLKTLLSNAQP